MSSILKGAKSKWMDIDGKQLHFIEKGNGKLLIFIHGVGSNCYAFKNQIDFLSRDFRCISVDIPGHNGSPDPPEDYSIPKMADIILTLIKNLEFDADNSIVIYGHSYGGGVAQYLLINRPELFSAAILAHTTSNTSKGIIQKLGTGLTPVGYPFAVSKLVRRFFARVLNNHLYSTSESIKRIGDDAVHTSASQILNMSRSMHGFNTDKSLKKVLSDVLVISGDMDPVFPYKHSKNLHEHLPNSILRVVPETAHQSHIERPETVNRYLKDFLFTLC